MDSDIKEVGTKNIQMLLKQKFPLKNIWISASAGSGKTRALTFHFLKFLLLGHEPNKILCLTYTKAGAVEMQERIFTNLKKWVNCSENDLKIDIFEILNCKFLEEDLCQSLVNRARKLFHKICQNSEFLKINTIHSFCQKILKQFPFEAGIDSHFQVIDENLAQQIIDEAKLSILNSNEPEVIDVINQLATTYSDFRFGQLIKEIINKREKISDLSENYEKNLSNLLNIKHFNEDSIIQDSHANLLKNKEKLIEIINLMLNPSSNNYVKNASLIENFLFNQNNFYDFTKVFINQDGTPKKQLYLKKMQESMHNIDEILQEIQRDVLEKIEQINSLKIYNNSINVEFFARKIIDKYEEVKNKYSYLDYDDVINIALKTLQNSEQRDWILYRLDGGIDHILVDEAQDTSLKQWQIIEALTQDFFGDCSFEKTKTIFVVGDEKQSIFSFQGANLQNFNEIYRKFTKKSADSAIEMLKVNLNKSYRSTKEVLGFVDEIFGNDNLRQKITSENQVKHLIHRKDQPGFVTILPLVEKEEFDENILNFNELDFQSQKIKTAKIIANEISQIINERNLRPSDIMVLVRKRDEFIYELIKNLKNHGIATSGVDRVNLSNEILIQDLIAIAKFMLLPEDELNLVTFLKTPFGQNKFQFSEESIFELAYAREGNCWDEICKNLKFQIIKEFYDELNVVLSENDLFGFFFHILENLEFRNIYLQYYGNKINEICDEFINQIYDFQRQNSQSLQKFIAWFEARDLQVKRENISHNEVQIMTVHGSKGLQAPIVFLVEALTKNLNNSIIYFDEDTFLCNISAQNRNKIIKNLIEKENVKENEEYFRLLYVGLTRAENELYVAAYGSKIEGSWYEACLAAKEKIPNSQLVNLLHESQSDAKKTQFNEDLSFLGKKFLLSKDVPEANSENYDRGLELHKVFESLANFHSHQERQIHLSNCDLGEEEREKFINISLKYSEIFENAHSEVAISKNGRSFYIDRMLIGSKNIHIIEFKSDQFKINSAADFPESYLKQINNYAKIIQEIYPDYLILKAFLWFENEELIYL